MSLGLLHASLSAESLAHCPIPRSELATCAVECLRRRETTNVGERGAEGCNSFGLSHLTLFELLIILLKELRHLLPQQLELFFKLISAHIVLFGLVNAAKSLWDALK